MSVAWEILIRKGNDALDREELAVAMRHGASQGLRVEHAPLTGGGYAVRALVPPAPVLAPAGAMVPYAARAVVPVAAARPVLRSTMCEGCHAECELKDVVLMQNVGALV